jgi:hypothetical protein
MRNLQRERQEILVDVEKEDEGLSDATVDDSVIHVNIPPPSTPTLPAQQSQVEVNLPDHERTADESPYGAGLDGSSDLRDSPSATAVLKATYFLARMSATVTRALNGLSLRPPQTSSAPATTTTTTPSKRGRDEEFESPGEADTGVLGADMTSRKRFKSTETTSSASSERDTIEVRMNGEHIKTRTKMRQTRHSRLSIEFIPQQWNRRPEREYPAQGSGL